MFCKKQFHIEPTVTIHLSEYNSLKQAVIDLQQLVETLQKEILLLKNGRKSDTSSTPPSQDISRSNQKSLREPSLRKSGGQPGHKGSSLEMTEKPDVIIKYRADFCNTCGEKLDSETATLTMRKQEIDIPPIVPQYIEHQSYSCMCKKCGHNTVAHLPARLGANIQYGPGVQAMVCYLSVRQYVPYNRVVELMHNVFNIKLSEGTVDNILEGLKEKALPIYEMIRQKVEQAPVVGGDETGIKINKAKGWLFTFQTAALTFLTVSYSRGFQTIQTLFKNGFPMSVYVTDCLPAQLKTIAKAHQICVAHLQRELNNFIEVFNCTWSLEMKQLLQQAIELKRQLQPSDYLHEDERVILLETKLNLLLQTTPENKNKKVQAFFKRLNKNHNAILTFLHHPKVPPDNNASERAIRNAKVKMKVSNQFKVFAGAYRFAVIRSVIDTTIKNSQKVFNALTCLTKFAAE